MIESEFNAAVQSGAIQTEPTEEVGPETTSPSPSSVPIEQFIPLLMQLQSAQRCLTAAPTFIPQTFQDQIQFVFNGADYFLYLYFNNQWNSFSVSGGGASGVTQILAGTGISISPGGGTGIVTINCTIDDATLPMSDITTNNASTSQHGFVPKLPNDATKYYDGTGVFSVPPSGGGGMISATGTDTASGMTPISITHTITHGLGVLPKILSVQIPQMLAPTVSGSSTSYEAQNGWIYLNGVGVAVGGVYTQYHVIPGGGGSSTFDGAGTGPTSINSTSVTTGGTGATSIAINNITTTTFDIVYTATVSTGPAASFSFPTVSWIALA